MERNNMNNQYSTELVNEMYEKPTGRSGAALWKIALLVMIFGIALAAFGFLNGGGGHIMIDNSGIQFVPSGEYSYSYGYSYALIGEKAVQESELEEFNAIEINTAASEIELIESDQYGIEMNIDGEDKITWSVENGKLNIENSDNVAAYFMDFDRMDSFIKVYYPKDSEFKSAKLTALSGDIKIEGGTWDDVNIECMSGNIDITGGRWNDMKVESTSGDVVIDGARLLGETEIDCTSGDVDITTEGAGVYSYNLDAMSGEVEINGDEQGDSAEYTTETYNSITVTATSGDIDLELK